MSDSKTVIRVQSSKTLSDLLRLFSESNDDVVFVDENAVISEPHLELLTDFPRSATAALVGKQTEAADTLVRGGQVVSASSASHKTTEANRVFTGAIRLSKKQAPEINKALDQAISKNANGNPLDLLLVALVRATIRVDAVELIGATFTRSQEESVRVEVANGLARINTSLLRLKIANRANDGFFSVFFLRRVSKLVTWAAVKIRATPNQVTVASFAIGLFAAYLFAQGDTWSLIAGAVVLQASLIVDCVDGELARYTRRFSELGAWLDAITDRVKEYAVFLGLAYGAYLQDGQNLWAIAALLMVLQTFRHLSDYNFSQVVKARGEEVTTLPVDYLAAWDGIEPAAIKPESGLAANYHFKRARYWAGKIVSFPIAERWLAISVTAAIGGASLTFTVMPILAMISMFWVYRMRIAKSLQMEKSRIKSPLIVRQLDLGWAQGTFSVRFDWLEPSIIRAIELGGLILIFAITGQLNGESGAAAFAILFSIAFHHYDNMYRAMQGEQKPKWLGWLGLTVPGRLLLLVTVDLLGIGLEPIAGYFLTLFLVVSSIQWVIHRNTPRKLVKVPSL